MRKIIITMLMVLAAAVTQAQVKMQVSGVCRARIDTIRIFNYATQKTGGYVDIDCFIYHCEEK